MKNYNNDVFCESRVALINSGLKCTIETSVKWDKCFSQDYFDDIEKVFSKLKQFYIKKNVEYNYVLIRLVSEQKNKESIYGFKIEIYSNDNIIRITNQKHNVYQIAMDLLIFLNKYIAKDQNSRTVLMRDVDVENLRFQ